MTLTEAFAKADEAVEQGHLMPYPQACIALAKEVRRLQRRLKKEDSLIGKGLIATVDAQGNNKLVNLEEETNA